MNEINKTSKKQYTLLGIPAIITCLLLFSLLIFNVYILFEARKDPNGGGFIILYQMIFGVMFLPLLVLAISHCITCLISFLKREKSKKTSRSLGIASSLFGMIAMALALPCTFIFILDGIAVLFLLPVAFLELFSIVSLIIAMVLFIKNKA